MLRPTRPRRKPQFRRKASRPEEIKLAALEVFAEHGFAGASIDAIAERAGMASGTIYRYYNSKEEILRAVVKSTFPSPNDQIIVSDSSELAQRVATGATALVDPSMLTIMRVLLIESRKFPDIARVWRDTVFQPILESVAEWMQVAQARQEIQQGDPKVQAFSMMAPILTAALLHGSLVYDPKLNDEAMFVEKHVATMMQGLRVRNVDGP
jgi:AcrR family transcriptional regulator